MAALPAATPQVAAAEMSAGWMRRDARSRERPEAGRAIAAAADSRLSVSLLSLSEEAERNEMQN